MAKANYLGQIRKRMDSLRKEYSALTEAYTLLSSASGTRGRKAAIPSLEALVSVASVTNGRKAGKKTKGTGKRGRPALKPKAAKSVGRPSGKRRRNGNISTKIVDIVTKNNRFTTNSVITDKLVSLYPGKDRAELGKYISVILANMKARKELVVLTTDAQGKKMRSGLWGLPSWVEGNKPKATYLK
ncbi:MAG: hypothetical protein K1X54_02345 [Flavobacteriales bacterium]|nr:hypothetical protein [Flavobacteriales bacterium]